MTAEIGSADTVGRRLEDGLVDRARAAFASRVPRLGCVVEDGGPAEQHRHRVRDVLAEERRRGAVRRLGHRDRRLVSLVEGEQHALGAGDRPEHGHDEVREAVPVAVERGHDQRMLAGPGDQARVGGVDQHRPVGDVGVLGGGGVHLLLEHSLVDRADGPLRPAVDGAAHLARLAERVLRHRVTGRTGDLLGTEGLLFACALRAFPPLLCAVGVVDRHPDDRDRVVRPADRRDAGDAAAGADDDLAVDLLAEEAVRGADVVLALRRDRRGLDAEP